MKLSELLREIKDYKIFGPRNLSLSGITEDSRKVKKGNLFVAIKGIKSDGHAFIAEAIKKGASVIVGEEDPKKFDLENKTYIRVVNSRQDLSLLASALYGNPSKKLKIIGVTGTDGKTTTATLIYSILKTAGKKVGLISTVSAKINDKIYDTGFHVTNPEPLALQKFLSLMLKEGCEWVVLEVTSHGLDQERVFGIPFEVSVLTNITHEHLDYHETYENYLKSKAKLFANSKAAILNAKDSSYEKIKSVLRPKLKILSYDSDLLEGKIKEAVLKRFPEKYNQENATGAIAVAKVLDINDYDIVHSIEVFSGIPGRLEEIKTAKGFKIFIDFAHTPNALENVLTHLRSKTKGKLISVFGCAGERDIKKRPMMAEISTRLADISVFTAEDPRSEKIEDILAQMRKGIENKGAKVYEIPNRGEAISFAINKLAKKGDIVVVCGKGHEKSMAYDHTEYPWSDYEAVKIALK